MNTWTLPADVYDAMVRHVEKGYPEEACGLIFGDPQGERLVAVPMENQQNEMHERDPERFPRDARTAYYFDPAAFQATLDEQDAGGREMRSIYHSHPDHEAYFSKKDREDAAPPGWGPHFPGVIYVVFSVREERVVDVKGFIWDEAGEDFVEMVISREAREPR